MITIASIDFNGFTSLYASHHHSKKINKHENVLSGHQLQISDNLNPEIFKQRNMAEMANSVIFSVIYEKTWESLCDRENITAGIMKSGSK